MFVKALLSETTFSGLIKNTIVELLSIVREKNEKIIYLACYASSKGSMNHMVKKISVFDLKNNRLVVVVLDSDVCKGTNTKTVDAMNHSF